MFFALDSTPEGGEIEMENVEKIGNTAGTNNSSADEEVISGPQDEYGGHRKIEALLRVVADMYEFESQN